MYLLKPCLLALVLFLSGLASASAQALVQADRAWVRVSVPGQTTSGAYMRLTAREPLTLLGAQSPVAAVVEVHEMKMDGDIMRMRHLPSLTLPAGHPVELRPGGLHLMLIDLKTQLRPGMRVPLTLLVRDAQGVQRRVEFEVPVSARAPEPAGAARADGHGSGHRH